MKRKLLENDEQSAVILDNQRNGKESFENSKDLWTDIEPKVSDDPEVSVEILNIPHIRNNQKELQRGLGSVFYIYFFCCWSVLYLQRTSVSRVIKSDHDQSNDQLNQCRARCTHASLAYQSQQLIATRLQMIPHVFFFFSFSPLFLSLSVFLSSLCSARSVRSVFRSRLLCVERIHGANKYRRRS